MTSLSSSNGFITANPLSEFDEDEELALGGQQRPQPQVSSRQMNLSNSSTGSSTLSPQSRATTAGGQLSSSGIAGDFSAASGRFFRPLSLPHCVRPKLFLASFITHCSKNLMTREKQVFSRVGTSI